MSNIHQKLKAFICKIDENCKCYSDEVEFNLSNFKLSLGKMEVIIRANILAFDSETVSFVEENDWFGITTLTIPINSIVKLDSYFKEMWTRYGIIEYLGAVE